tara:strand:+ start:3402 stop:3641 length:240 start_codon:yes stop_codon:yes gene_type:complete
MELLEEELFSIAVLVLRKAKIEKKLRQTFKCILRKLFTCCGMKNLEVELHSINEELKKINKRQSISRPIPHRKLSTVSV